MSNAQYKRGINGDISQCKRSRWPLLVKHSPSLSSYPNSAAPQTLREREREDKQNPLLRRCSSSFLSFPLEVLSVALHEPGVPDDELVAPRRDEEVVRQHDQVAGGGARARKLKSEQQKYQPP